MFQRAAWIVCLLLLVALPVTAQNGTANATTPSTPPGSTDYDDAGVFGSAPRGLISTIVEEVSHLLPPFLQGEVPTFALTLLAWALFSAIFVLLLIPAIKWLTRHTKTELDDIVIAIVSRPLFYLLFVYGLVDSLLALSLPSNVDSLIFRVWNVVIVIQVATMAYKLWKEVLLNIGERVASKTETELDDKLYPLVSKVGSVVIIFGAIWLGISSFGIDMTFFAAGGAIGGLVIAFAAQDTLGNFFAGIQILIDRPFREGDRIEIKEEDTWGDVVEIGLRTTRIRTRDNRLVIVPNSVIGSNPVINHSLPSSLYRLETHVGIAYGSDIEKARAAMIEATSQVDGVRNDHPIEALFVEFGDSSLVFRVRWWLGSYQDTRRIFDKVHTALDKRLREEGIEIPFPQRVLWNGAQPGSPVVATPTISAD